MGKEKPKLLSSISCKADFKTDKCLFDKPEYRNKQPFEVCQHCDFAVYGDTKLGKKVKAKQDNFKDAPLLIRTIKSVEDIEKLAEDMGEIVDIYPIGCAV